MSTVVLCTDFIFTTHFGSLIRSIINELIIKEWPTLIQTTATHELRVMAIIVSFVPRLEIDYFIGWDK